MHCTIMLLLYAVPVAYGFANAILPLQIGAPDVAFPRLNAFAFWLFLFGSTIAVAGFLTPQGAASFGWFAYQPLAGASFSPGAGGNLWMVGLRSEEHTSELQSLMRTSYAVFCLKKQN